MATRHTASQSTRVLFARIGWMTYYAGPQTGDEYPKGGGDYNRTEIGHEVFNFAGFDGRVYGYVRAKSGRINLGRIEPSAAKDEKLDNVLIIFVAKQRVIGWYQKATVYAHTNPNFPAPVKAEMRRILKQSPTKAFTFLGYCLNAYVADATLLPLHERDKKKWRIPGNVKGGFGESNLRYPFGSKGLRNCPAWMNKAIQAVLDYRESNLLTDSFPEVNPEEAAELVQEKSQGYQSDPIIRRIIERHAMEEAQRELRRRGYRSFEDTSATKPYDLTCQRQGQTFYVEVKGTQTTGGSIILTRNEVEHVRNGAGSCILVVVHSVELDGKTVSKAGTPSITENWDLEKGELTETQFLWKKGS